jgi:hypothetical protein
MDPCSSKLAIAMARDGCTSLNGWGNGTNPGSEERNPKTMEAAKLHGQLLTKNQRCQNNYFNPALKSLVPSVASIP